MSVKLGDPVSFYFVYAVLFPFLVQANSTVKIC